MSTESNEFEGKNLDLAVWNASQELEIAIEKLRYKIVEKGRRGHGDDPGQPTRIRVLSAEEAEAAAAPAAPAREEPRRESPPRRESRTERDRPRQESRSRRDEEPSDKLTAEEHDEADETAPLDEPRAADEMAVDDDHDADDLEEAAPVDELRAGDEIVADADDLEEVADEIVADADEDDEDDLEEPPSASSALLEDDDPIEIAREARRRSARSRDERVEAAQEDRGPADDEPAVEAREPQRERSPRRRSSRSRDERVEAAQEDRGPADDEPVVEAREPRRERSPRRRSSRSRDERVEAANKDRGPADDEPAVEAREPRRERPPRRPESRRPEGSLDPDDLDSGMEKAREIVPQLLSQMGFDLEMDAEIQEDHVYVPLTGEDCKYLLEHRAEGLNALQFLVNKMVYRGGPTRILVDADGYRQERQKELVERAHAVADEVRDGGNSRSLGSLNPFERRLVHIALRDDEDVRTLSKGEGFLKRMEIAPKHGGGGNESGGSERGGRRRRERY